MTRQARFQSARGWLRTYSGRDVVRGYRKWYGVSTVCAIIELRQLGVAVSDERLTQAKTTEDHVTRQRVARKQQQITPDLWPDSDGTFAYIAGYTSGGVPYGVRWKELEASAQPPVTQVDVVDLDERRDEGDSQ